MRRRAVKSRKSKKIYIILIVLFIFGLGFGLTRYLTLDIAKTDTVFFSNRVISDNSIEFHGMLKNTSGFKGFEYHRVKKDLYIKIHTGKIRLYELKWSGKVDISIKDNVKNVERIYLQGKDNKDEKLLWEKP